MGKIGKKRLRTKIFGQIGIGIEGKRDGFAKYKRLKDFVAAYVKNMKNNPVYKKRRKIVRKNSKDVQGYLDAIARSYIGGGDYT